MVLNSVCLPETNPQTIWSYSISQQGSSKTWACSQSSVEYWYTEVILFARVDLADVLYNWKRGTIHRPYTVTDERSNLTGYLLPQFGLAAMREINSYLNVKKGLPVSRTQCVQLSGGEIEGCRRTGNCFHCAINFESNYLDSWAHKVLTALDKCK